VCVCVRVVSTLSFRVTCANDVHDSPRSILIHPLDGLECGKPKYKLQLVYIGWKMLEVYAQVHDDYSTGEVWQQIYSRTLSKNIGYTQIKSS
jgi:hypothetical protein